MSNEGNIMTAKVTAKPAAGTYDPALSPTESQYGAFARVFAHFNERLFGGKLPGCMLTFSRKSKALGFFAPERWADSGGGCLHEIALNPDHMATRSPRDSASTIVHEMVHHWQQCEGSPSRRGYHNKEWGDKMETVGLMPSDTGCPGGKRTGQRMTHYIIEGGAFDAAFAALAPDAFLPFTSNFEKLAGKSKKDRSKTPFVCPGCGSKCWGKPELRIICGDCEIELEARS